MSSKILSINILLIKKITKPRGIPINVNIDNSLLDLRVLLKNTKSFLLNIATRALNLIQQLKSLIVAQANPRHLRMLQEIQIYRQGIK